MSLSNGLRVFVSLGIVLVGIALPAVAAPPTVVLSVKSVDELLDDADFIGETVGQSGLKELVETQIAQITGGVDEDGIDRDRPVGFYWSITESDPSGVGILVAFVPVSNSEDFESLVKKFVPNLKVDDGEWSISVQGMPPLYAKIANEYCYVSNSQDGLSKLLDVSKLVDGEHDVAVDVYLSSIPQALKEVFLTTVEDQGRQSMRNDPAPKNEAEAKARELGFQWTMAGFKLLINDGDRLKFGVNVDSETRMAALDMSLTGAPKSVLANAMSVFGKTVPAFAVVAGESAPLRMVISHPTTGLIEMMDELFTLSRSSANSSIDEDPKLKDEGDKKAAKDVVNRLFTIAQATVKSGALHSVVILDKGEGGTAQIVAGTKVAKGDDAGKLWDDILKLSKESPDLAKVKTDAAKHAGARIHSISADADDKHVALFGTEPTHVAIRADSLWMSLGGGNLTALKTALDLSGKKATKSESPISLRIKPATLVTLMEKDDVALIERAKAMAGESGDVLNIEVAPMKGAGVMLHIEFGVDLFSLSGAADHGAAMEKEE